MFNRILLPLDRSALARVMLQAPQLIIFDEAAPMWDNSKKRCQPPKVCFKISYNKKANRLT